MLKLNLLLNGLVSSLDNAIQGDTLVSPYHKSDDGKSLKQFDYVVSNPPFKMDFSDTRDDIEKKWNARFVVKKGNGVLFLTNREVRHSIAGNVLVKQLCLTS